MASFTTLSLLGLVAGFRRGPASPAAFDPAPVAAPTLAPTGRLLPQGDLPEGDRPLPALARDTAVATATSLPTSGYVLKRRSVRRRNSGYSPRPEARM